MKKILLTISTVFFVLGCSSSTPNKNEIDVVTPQQTQSTRAVVKHDDLEPLTPFGFKDACRNCANGYTTKTVCGKYYNPACSFGSTSSGLGERKLLVKANTPHKKKESEVIKNLPKPLAKNVNVFKLKKGEVIKIEVPNDGVVIVKSSGDKNNTTKQ